MEISLTSIFEMSNWKGTPHPSQFKMFKEDKAMILAQIEKEEAEEEARNRIIEEEKEYSSPKAKVGFQEDTPKKKKAGFAMDE